MHEFDFTAFRDQGIERIGELNPYITLACDLRCRYCYMYDFLENADNKLELMDPDFLFGLINFFSDSGNGLDRMTLLGGEPTLHPDITEIIDVISNMPIKEKRMTTNGIGTHHLKLEKLKPEALEHISVSIDGTNPETNDPTRGRGTFENILETIGKYSQTGIKLSINYTVTSNNLSQLNEVIPFFAEKGVSIINFHRASLDGYAYANPDLIVKASDWINARDNLSNYIHNNSQQFPGLTIRIPYIFLTPRQIEHLNYKPIQEQNYHSPQGGHRLIVFPPTKKGHGLCYMSSDLIGQPNAELGYVTTGGSFVWNEHQSNEFTAYARSFSSNVSTEIKNQSGEIDSVNIVRVSHSFKAVINT